MADQQGMLLVLQAADGDSAATVNPVDLLDCVERELLQRACWRDGWAWTLTPKGRQVLETGKPKGQR